jgi:hypothetical protein
MPCDTVDWLPEQKMFMEKLVKSNDILTGVAMHIYSPCYSGG